MTVFDLDRSVVKTYESFARSFTRIEAADIREAVDTAYKDGRYWPKPLIQLNPTFESGPAVGELVHQGSLTRGTEQIFRGTASDGSLKLHRHQFDALTHALDGKSYVVTTGTGSGKSVRYFLPIVDRILRAKAKGERKRTRAIIIYPMNALANSQFEEIGKRIRESPFAGKITYDLYTGQQASEKRQDVRTDPPDILLTNFMMLELLLTRQAELDKDVIKNCEGLEFLVLDELHTYRGRQGADVAMLVRRVRDRLQRGERLIQCIGTSATMSSEAEIVRRQERVAQVASTLFATTISADAVVTEHLERVTDRTMVPRTISPAQLKDAADLLRQGRTDDASLRRNRLMAWIEMTLGLSEKHGRLERAVPLDLVAAAKELAKAAGMGESEAETALEHALETASKKGTERGGSTDRVFFPIRLHRFISGAGKVYSTLEAPGRRKTVLDGQKFLPGREDDVRLFSTYFCRNCGQEHHPVTLVTADKRVAFLARDIDEVVGDDEAGGQRSEVGGFLTPATGPVAEFGGDIDDYPDEWKEPSGKKLKQAQRKYQLVAYTVAPDGKTGERGTLAWFQPGKFRFCPSCKDTHSTSGRDINRLAGLTAEGRSSATTTLVGAVLDWMNAGDNVPDAKRRKVLGFSDNRQDTALQAGHYNDFVFITLLRGATLAALTKADTHGLDNSTVGRAIAGALGFTPANADRHVEWLADAGLTGRALEDASSDLSAMIAHRFWYDQRRGWRFTFPNLEQLGLVRVDYNDLNRIADSDERYVGPLAPLRSLCGAERLDILRAVLDAARQGLAVRSDALGRPRLEELKNRRHRLVKPWAFSDEERVQDAGVLALGRTDIFTGRDHYTVVRTGMQSALGRKLRRLVDPHLKTKPYDDLIAAIVALLTPEFLAEVPVDKSTGFRVVAEAVRFHLGDVGEKANDYFVQLYRSIATDLGSGGVMLFGNEAREHTAQVDQKRRQAREKRFRGGPRELQDLQEQRAELRQMGESTRFLPVMFCSPTMELGVDISELDAVYLRNVPPTPANYAQRSGRAGRGGAAALVLTYCSAQSPHDQFFFGRRDEMIQGVVRPPSIDLANQDLVRSHLHAVWLAESGQALPGTISNLVDTSKPHLPLAAELHDSLSGAGQYEKSRERLARLSTGVAMDLGQSCPTWLENPTAFAETVAASAAHNFAGAFSRWRTLLSAAKGQLDEAQKIIADLSIKDRRLRSAAELRHSDAEKQIGLLLQGSESGGGGDFNTYRYLATEGFLPGYNFPRLPLMAFIPGQGSGGDSRRHAFVQRPRFLAISEFGPHSRIYHEGRTYRVSRLQLASSDHMPGARTLITEQVWLCRSCGARDEREPERCHACEDKEGWDPINDVKRVENVATELAEQITANDEERQRQGFEIITTFRWPKRNGLIDALSGAVVTGGVEVATLRYAPAASLQRLNLGRRRRKDSARKGFDVDLASGRWLSAEDPAEASDNSGKSELAEGPRQLIVPMVEDHKNALLLRPSQAITDETAFATVQHALMRGIEAEFQLEEGEILAEPMPSRYDRRQLLFYEASEGGAGVLARLVREPDAVARVVSRALMIMHLKSGDLPPRRDSLEDIGTDACKKGCYRCLLSYFNQPDHELIDRHNAQAIDLLCALAASSTTYEAAPRSLMPTTTAISTSPDREFLAEAEAAGLPAPGCKVSGQGWQFTWKSNMVVALLGPAAADKATLESMEYEIFEVPLEASKWLTVLAAVRTAMDRQK